MFIKIETNGATCIAINVPHAVSHVALPAIAAMFENNAVFVQESWSDTKVVEPKISVLLSDRVTVSDNGDAKITVSPSSDVLTVDPTGESESATPQAFLDYSKLKKRYNDETAKHRTEVSYLKQESDELKAKLELAEGVNGELRSELRAALASRQDNG